MGSAWKRRVPLALQIEVAEFRRPQPERRQRPGRRDAHPLALQHPRVPVLVQAFVEERLLELVRWRGAIEVAVAELVDGDEVAPRGATVGLERAVGGEERLVLHAARLAGVVGRHHHGRLRYG